jgi:cephalosporin-C deacetylase-like acetyl esterase
MFGAASRSHPQTPRPAQNQEYEALQAHFEKVVGRRSEQLFAGITTVAQWEERKKQSRAALAKMLWHDLRLPDSPPPATVTHTEQRETYTLENVVIETAPKLFLTANLYLPKSGSKPFPVVLYQCGHASKNVYARHGAWFAEHGIAALVMDNIEMGEAEFTHHGVYSNAWFHWYSRGFSPLAVELLNARRAVDYLASRPDLDRARIGATGRSGGGMTTFFLAALDDRIKASAPVSGTLSTTGWVKHRLSEAHCDCQYPVNSYGMLYSEVGALIAPRAHMEVNADADSEFPMDSFNELIGKMKQVYRLYGAEGTLRTAVTPGGHSDIEVIRLPVYSFFLKEFLGVESPVATEGPVDVPMPDTLACYRKGLPIEERLSRIDEELIPVRPRSAQPLRPAARQGRVIELTTLLRQEVFRYFPPRPEPLDPQWGAPSTVQGRTVQKVTFTSFEGLRVKGSYSLPARVSPDTKLPAILLADHRQGIPVWGNEQPLDRNEWGERAVLIVETINQGSRALERNLRSFSDNDPLHHMRRQAMVAGTTLESMQLYELQRALALLRSLPNVDSNRITLTGRGEMGVHCMYAALLDSSVQRVIVGSPTTSHLQGPHYLGILRYTDVPEIAALLAARLRIYGETPTAPASPTRCSGLADCLKR